MTQTTDEASQLRADALYFGRQAEQFTLDSLSYQHAGQGDGVRIALVAMAVRMYRSHQAIRQLVEANLNDGAAAVLRGLLEQYFVLKALVRDPQDLKLAVEEAMSERRKALKGLTRMHASDRGAEVTDEALEAAIAEITAKKEYNVYEWAEKADCLDVYHTIWRRLCAYAHGCLLAIEEYVVTTSDGVVHGVTSVVERDASIDFIITSGGLLLEAIKSIDKAPGTELQRSRFQILLNNFSRLRTRYWELCGAGLDGLT